MCANTFACADVYALRRGWRLRFAALLVSGHVVQGLAVADAVCPALAVIADHARNVVRDEDAAEVNVDQGAHQLLHVGVAVVDIGLDEVPDGRGDARGSGPCRPAPCKQNEVIG